MSCSIIMKPNNAANADFASAYARFACKFLFTTLDFYKKTVMRIRTMACTKRHLHFCGKIVSLANHVTAGFKR